MEYAKLNNGNLSKFVIFPNGLSILDGKFKRNPTEADILAAGYLPIEDTAEPVTGEGFIKSSKWVETDTAIVKKWTVKRDMRPLSQGEISKKLIAQQINSLAADNNTALRMKAFYPIFDSIIGQKVKQGFRFTYGDKLYATAQPEMTIQAHYPPGVGTESLYEEVCEEHDGSLYDAIPYSGNMALENGKYYSEDGVTYLCNRDTGIAVHHRLSELVGQYVEVAYSE